MFRADIKPAWVAVSVFIAVLLVASGLSWKVVSNQQRQASSNLANDVLRASGQIDLLIDRLRLATQSLVQGLNPEDLTFDITGHSIASIDGFRTALTISPEGFVVDESREGKPALGIDVSDRSYVREHQRQSSHFYVAAPIYSRVDGVWSLPVSVPVRSEDGALQGIAAIAVGAEYFSSVGDIISDVGAVPFIRRQGFDDFLPLADGEDPEQLENFISEFEPAELAGNSRARFFETPIGWMFFYASAIGDFDLAVMLPQTEITKSLNRHVAIFVALSLSISAFCAIIAGVISRAWQMRRRQLEQTKRLEERLRLAAHAANVGIWDMDLVTGVLSWDTTMHKLYGVSEANFQGTYQDWRSCLHPDDIEKAEAEFGRSLETSEAFASQFKIITKKTVRHIRAEASVIKDNAGRAVRVIGANFDVTGQVNRERELDQARHVAEDMHAKIELDAIHDSLTGLLNRRGLEKAIEAASPKNGDQTLILIDLDRFKLVNDSFGHQAGDAVLCAVSDRLRTMKQTGDIVARIGGDEFVVLRPGANPAATEEWALDANLALSEPVGFNESVCRFGVSMGAAHGLVDALQSGALTQCADHALYQAKKDGRGLFRYFTQQLSQSLADVKVLSNDLEQAIGKDEFSLVYMPKIEITTGQLSGLEALIRWHHPERGMLLPGAFLGIAESLKLTGQIDGHVLDLVLRDRELWQQQGLTAPNVSVNVSTRRLKDPDLVDIVKSKSLPPGAINFELLESVFLDDLPVETNQSLDALRSLGIGIEIDDFGSGHASILAIPRINPDFIKIDRALIKSIDCDEPARQTVSSIIDMAKSYSVKVIAEGVETDRQLSVLRDLGCDAAQGFLFGKHMTAPDVLDSLCLRQTA